MAFNLLLARKRVCLRLDNSDSFELQNFGILDHIQGRPILVIVQSCSYHSLEESVSFIKTVNKLKDIFFVFRSLNLFLENARLSTTDLRNRSSKYL